MSLCSPNPRALRADALTHAAASRRNINLSHNRTSPSHRAEGKDMTRQWIRVAGLFPVQADRLP